MVYFWDLFWKFECKFCLKSIHTNDAGLDFEYHAPGGILKNSLKIVKKAN